MRTFSVTARSIILAILTMATAHTATAGGKKSDPDKVREKLLVLARDLSSKDPVVKIKTLEEILAMGKEAKAISPGVCKRLFDEDKAVRLVALDTIKKINPNLSNVILPLLRRPVAGTNSPALEDLARMGKSGAAALPVVMKYIEAQESKGNVPVDAKYIALALASIAPKDEAAVKKVLSWLALPGPKESVARAGAAQALGHMAGGDEAVKALVNALRTDPVNTVRKWSATSLGILGADQKDVQAALENARTDRDEDVRTAARKALEKLKGK